MNKGSTAQDKIDQGPEWHMRKAFEWLVASHNHIQYITGFPGQSHFQLDDDISSRPSWDEWPIVTICIDQGSDGWCAANFLKYKKRLRTPAQGPGSQEIPSLQAGSAW